MLNTSRMQRSITQKTILFVAIAIVLWILLLITGATHVRNTGLESSTYDVTLGPLLLNQITKTATAGGQVVGFSFGNGLLWYFLFWTACGIFAGWLTGRRPKTDA